MRYVTLILLGLAACRPAEKSPPGFADSVATTGTPDPASRIAFAILAPKAGDTLVEGAVYTIHWWAGGAARINLGAAMGGHDKGYLLTDAPSIPDSLVWTVPVGFVTGFGVKTSSDMRLRLEDAGDPTRYVETGPFTIVGAR
ncbi:MAG: hypothetical protein ABI836_03500 [Gemmatimonadota bacterium]